MQKLGRLMTGTVAAALLAVAVAAPAQAHYDRYDRYGRAYYRGSVIGDIISSVAILGGISAVTSALDRDFGRYGFGGRYRYRDGYTTAVNSCGNEAERIGRGRVRITDVERTGGDHYRVRGVVEADGLGYGRYDENDRYDGYDSYDRYGHSNRYGSDGFTCYARGSGRITDFRI